MNVMHKVIPAILMASSGLVVTQQASGGMFDFFDFFDNNDDYRRYGRYGGPYGWGNPYGYGGPYGWGRPYGYGGPYGWGGSYGWGYPRVMASSTEESAPELKTPE